MRVDDFDTVVSKQNNGSPLAKSLFGRNQPKTPATGPVLEGIFTENGAKNSAPGDIFSFGTGFAQVSAGPKALCLE